MDVTDSCVSPPSRPLVACEREVLVGAVRAAAREHDVTARHEGEGRGRVVTRTDRGRDLAAGSEARVEVAVLRVARNGEVEVGAVEALPTGDDRAAGPRGE